MDNREETTPQNTSPTSAASGSSAPGSGARDPRSDDRRGTVNPAQNPVPSSPEPDEAAVQAGEENLGRVKPY